MEHGGVGSTAAGCGRSFVVFRTVYDVLAVRGALRGKSCCILCMPIDAVIPISSTSAPCGASVLSGETSKYVARVDGTGVKKTSRQIHEVSKPPMRNPWYAYLTDSIGFRCRPAQDTPRLSG